MSPSHTEWRYPSLWWSITSRELRDRHRGFRRDCGVWGEARERRWDKPKEKREKIGRCIWNSPRWWIYILSVLCHVCNSETNRTREERWDASNYSLVDWESAAAHCEKKLLTALFSTWSWANNDRNPSAMSCALITKGQSQPADQLLCQSSHGRLHLYPLSSGH